MGSENEETDENKFISSDQILGCYEVWNEVMRFYKENYNSHFTTSCPNFDLNHHLISSFLVTDPSSIQSHFSFSSHSKISSSVFQPITLVDVVQKLFTKNTKKIKQMKNEIEENEEIDLSKSSSDNNGDGEMKKNETDEMMKMVVDTRERVLTYQTIAHFCKVLNFMISHFSIVISLSQFLLFQ